MTSDPFTSHRSGHLTSCRSAIYTYSFVRCDFQGWPQVPTFCLFGVMTVRWHPSLQVGGECSSEIPPSRLDADFKPHRSRRMRRIRPPDGRRSESVWAPVRTEVYAQLTVTLRTLKVTGPGPTSAKFSTRCPQAYRGRDRGTR